MRNKSIDVYLGTLIFLSGSLICYILLQFHLFEVELKLNVPELTVSIGTAISAIYIAQTIQKKLTKMQNRYAYLESKLDGFWNIFNTFSQDLNISDTIALSSVSGFTKSSNLALSFLKGIFSTYNLSDTELSTLENKIDTLSDFLETLPIASNVIDIRAQKPAIKASLVDIERNFSRLLRLVHEI